MLGGGGTQNNALGVMNVYWGGGGREGGVLTGLESDSASVVTSHGNLQSIG